MRSRASPSRFWISGSRGASARRFPEERERRGVVALSLERDGAVVGGFRSRWILGGGAQPDGRRDRNHHCRREPASSRHDEELWHADRSVASSFSWGSAAEFQTSVPRTTTDNTDDLTCAVTADARPVARPWPRVGEPRPPAKNPTSTSNRVLFGGLDSTTIPRVTPRSVSGDGQCDPWRNWPCTAIQLRPASSPALHSPDPTCAGGAGSMLRIAEICHRPSWRAMTNVDHMRRSPPLPPVIS